MTDHTAPGAPRSWNPDRDFVQVSRHAVERVGLIDAYVFALIKFRSTNRDGWTATAAEIATETGLPVSTVRKALARLRDGQFVTAKRRDDLDATLTWAPNWLPDERSSRDDLSGQGGDPLRSGGVTSQVISSYKKEEELKEAHSATAESAIDRLISVHADCVAAWTTAPRADLRTRRAVGRLLERLDEQTIQDGIVWAQADADFWRTRTRSLCSLAKSFDTIDEQRRSSAKQGVHRPLATPSERRARTEAYGW